MPRDLTLPLPLQFFCTQSSIAHAVKQLIRPQSSLTISWNGRGSSAKGTMGRIDDSRKLCSNRPDVMVYFEKFHLALNLPLCRPPYWKQDLLVVFPSSSISPTPRLAYLPSASLVNILDRRQKRRLEASQSKQQLVSIIFFQLYYDVLRQFYGLSKRAEYFRNQQRSRPVNHGDFQKTSMTVGFCESRDLLRIT